MVEAVFGRMWLIAGVVGRCLDHQRGFTSGVRSVEAIPGQLSKVREVRQLAKYEINV